MTSLPSIYPNIAAWTESHGWIEIGQDEDAQSIICALDVGGIVYIIVEGLLLTFHIGTEITVSMGGTRNP